jgi:hypothetical protein
MSTLLHSDQFEDALRLDNFELIGPIFYYEPTRKTRFVKEHPPYNLSGHYAGPGITPGTTLWHWFVRKPELECEGLPGPTHWTGYSVSPGHLAWSRGFSASQSAHHFMYLSLGHGHLSPEHDTSQYTLQHTSSPAPNCLHTHHDCNIVRESY